MSVRVNLLPRADAARSSARRQWIILGGVAALLLIALVGASLWQIRQVDQARERLADEQTVLASLRAEQAGLQSYEQLEQREAVAEQRLVAALGAQASMAGVLQDLALVMPDSAAITTLSINLGGSGEPTPGAAGPVHGSVSISGEVVTGHAPGVEGVLRALDQVAAFRDVYFTTSTLDESASELLQDLGGEFAVFNVDLNLGPEVLTQRYENVGPEEQG